MKNEKKVYLISNGDFRDSAGQVCWPMQEKTLRAVKAAFRKMGYQTEVFPSYDPETKARFSDKAVRRNSSIFCHSS